MTRRLFGTDGVRGLAGQPPMDEATVYRLARAAALFFQDGGPGAEKNRRVVIGRDTRGSGETLARAVAAGFAHAGWETVNAGIAPTPAVALAVLNSGSSAGLMVTASHNPADYNGVKIFGPGGCKLTDSEEEAIEQRFAKIDMPSKPPTRSAFAADWPAAADHADLLGRLLPAGALDGWKLVVDCAHGATAATAPALLRGLGAEVLPLGVAPDGTNINHARGSEHPGAMAAEVCRTGAALGLALDGDGDRLVAADENGCVLSGDELLGVLASHGIRDGWMPKPVLAATVMANLGLDEMMASLGGRVLRAPVGDRHVAAAMREHGLSFGGESSGHLLFPDIGPAGDGLAGAVRLATVLLTSGEPLSRLRNCVRLYPQKTASLRVREKTPLNQLPRLRAAIGEAEAAMGERGRLLVRYSGTEPLLRFLVEAREAAEVERQLSRLLAVSASELSLVEG